MALQEIDRFDLCDPDGDLPEERARAHDRLRDVFQRSNAAGYGYAELYDYVVASEEARADWQAESGRDSAERDDHDA